eukprot:3349768-Rhodomonas_salina.1
MVVRNKGKLKYQGTRVPGYPGLTRSKIPAMSGPFGNKQFSTGVLHPAGSRHTIGTYEFFSRSSYHDGRYYTFTQFATRLKGRHTTNLARVPGRAWHGSTSAGTGTRVPGMHTGKGPQ